MQTDSERQSGNVSALRSQNNRTERKDARSLHPRLLDSEIYSKVESFDPAFAVVAVAVLPSSSIVISMSSVIASAAGPTGGGASLQPVTRPSIRMDQKSFRIATTFSNECVRARKPRALRIHKIGFG
jgi:hypothetical protein